ARGLLAQPRLNIADAMAWQRDAAKAGAPLSREPLAGVKQQLAERIKGIEDLQTRVQVQREAAVLLAQRIEVLSTKSWKDAEAAPQPKPARPKVDPELRAKASQAITEALAKVEQEVAQGHGKASAGAANALRNALKEHGKLVDDKLEAHAHAALGAATELEGWQRWRADQLRQELVAKAEGLFEPVPPATPPAAATADTDAAATAEAEAVSPAAAPEPPPARKPRYGGRKMQEMLRSLREQWKQVDQGGPPNHSLWKRFDEACNEAYTVVQEWLDK